MMVGILFLFTSEEYVSMSNYKDSNEFICIMRPSLTKGNFNNFLYLQTPGTFRFVHYYLCIWKYKKS